MSMNFEYHELTLANSESLHQLMQSELGYQMSLNQLKKWLDDIAVSSSDTVFVCVYDAQVIGYVQIAVYRSLLIGPALNIMGLAVAKDYQHCGIGRKLMSMVDELAWDLNINTIRLNSGSERHEAHNFYKKMGFHTDKQQLKMTKSIVMCQ